ncbi:monooxygenase [Kyrpidia spormannii]|uniref:Monooxygenase n=2 Tax=Kyrpidia spormannii TaxID=2055160 RepID=A0A2K8N7J0_9BACL|nr:MULTISPECIES: MmoB/DmpM family protein [Kyrpidia]HHY68547.1 monooxygenase [Alicyclobacillus sp.]ATY85319.1 monooxygenase [Kyrpidia spormannii]MCL6576815.1 MmoB/DmpM family protein [Kyrpidia sp.]CAB3393215.1 Monooxygenase [Kyrpidia spormannii]CAB3394138.1 Monooxygenase [Kyrpidia spormannii]
MSNEAYVGMDLDKNGGLLIDAILEALREDNPRIETVDFNIYVKVKSPREMVLKRETVEEKLGRDWDINELQVYMSSYFGFIEEWDDDHLLIRWNG